MERSPNISYIANNIMSITTRDAISYARQWVFIKKMTDILNSKPGMK